MKTPGKIIEFVKTYIYVINSSILICVCVYFILIFLKIKRTRNALFFTLLCTCKYFSCHVIWNYLWIIDEFKSWSHKENCFSFEISLYFRFEVEAKIPDIFVIFPTPKTSKQFRGLTLLIQHVPCPQKCCGHWAAVICLAQGTSMYPGLALVHGTIFKKLKKLFCLVYTAFICF